MITNQDRRGIVNLYRKIYKDLAPLLKQELLKKIETQEGVSPVGVHVVMAQNAMRICMESIYQEAMPNGEDEIELAQMFLYEMAIRLAGYSLTMLPQEKQEYAIEIVCANLKEHCANASKHGYVIPAEWVIDGVTVKNYYPPKELS